MSYLSFCYSVFGFIGRRYRNDKELGKSLNQAHMEMTPDAYVSWAFMTAVLSQVIILVAAIVILAVRTTITPASGESEDTSSDGSFLVGILMLVVLVITFVASLIPMYLKQITVDDLLVYVSGMAIGYFVYGQNSTGMVGFSAFILWTIFKFIFQINLHSGIVKGNYPQMKAKQRGKVADMYLPHAASFVSAMAASNATMEKIFLALSTQKAKKIGISYHVSKLFGQPTERDVFPIICEESAAIYRDTQILGVDTLSSIQKAVERAPSAWLAEFFQGISSTISSGGNLKLYFMNSAQRFMEDIKQQQRETLDQLATQAEMYVTVAVAMPIFLIIILIITMWVSTSGSQTGDSLGTLYMVVFILVPLLHFIFAMMTHHSINKFNI